MIEAIFIIYTIIMYRRGIASIGVIGFGCFAMAVIGAGCIAMAFINKKEDDNKLDFIEVPHAREGVIFEVLTVLIIAVAWIVAIATNRFWIVGEFYYLEPVTMFLLTILVITVLWIVYMPRFISMVRRHTNVKQAALEVRMCRVMAVELALFVLLYASPLGNPSTAFSYSSSRAFFYIAGAVLLITVAIFRYLIDKARSNPEDIEREATVDGFDIDHVKVPYTAMGLSIEVLVGVIVVLAWVLGAINGIFTEDDYYAGLMNPDMQTYNFERRGFMFLFTIYIFLTLWYTHRPDKIIEKNRWPKVSNLKQVNVVIRSLRVLAIIVAIFVLLMAFPSFNFTQLMVGLGVVTFIWGPIVLTLVKMAK